MIIDQFAGIQNTVSKRDMADNALQDSVNVDITNAGGFLARSGRVLSKTLTIDSVYTTLDGTTYLVSEGVLYRVGSSLELYEIGSSSATEFADYQSALFTNDGHQVLNDVLVNLNTVVTGQPEVVITGGSKPAGRYNVVVTYTNGHGLEGGTSLVATVTLESPGDVLVTPLEVTGYTANVYMTETDGTVFFNQATGLRLLPVQINANPFPESVEKIEYHQGRLYVSQSFGDNSVVYFSKPSHFHLFGLDDDYFVIPGNVLDMRSAGEGLVIGTDREIYVYQDGSLQKLASYGVVPGRPLLKLPDVGLLIHTVRGVCKALPFQPLTESKVSLAMGTQCATALMFKDGIQRYIAMHNGEGEAFNKAF